MNKLSQAATMLLLEYTDYVIWYIITHT